MKQPLHQVLLVNRLFCYNSVYTFQLSFLIIFSPFNDQYAEVDNGLQNVT
jgi:hypothetical protein